MAAGMVRVMRDEPVEQVLDAMVTAAERCSSATAGMMRQAIAEARAGVGPEYRGEDAQGRRLAGPVGPQEARDLAIRRDEGHVPRGPDLAESFLQAFDLDHGSGPE